LNTSPPVGKFRLRFLWWLLAALILVMVFLKVPLDDVIAAAGRGRLGRFAAVAVTFTLATYLLDSCVHLWLFRRFLPPVGAGTVFRARGESYLLLALGFVYGQGGMAYLMSRRTGKPVTETAGVLLFLMLNNLMAIIAFPTLALLLLAPDSGLRSSAEWRQIPLWLAGTWVVCAAVVLFWARDWKLPLRDRLKRGLGSTIDRARPRDYAIVISLRALQALSWCCFSWLGLGAFGVEIPLGSLLVLGPIVGLSAAIPTPGRLGTSQGAWLLLFGAHYDPARILAFSLCWTVGVNLCRWLLGAAFVAASRLDSK